MKTKPTAADVPVIVSIVSGLLSSGEYEGNHAQVVGDSVEIWKAIMEKIESPDSKTPVDIETGRKLFAAMRKALEDDHA